MSGKFVERPSALIDRSRRRCSGGAESARGSVRAAVRGRWQFGRCECECECEERGRYRVRGECECECEGRGATESEGERPEYEGGLAGCEGRQLGGDRLELVDGEEMREHLKEVQR